MDIRLVLDDAFCPFDQVKLEVCPGETGILCSKEKWEEHVLSGFGRAVVFSARPNGVPTSKGIAGDKDCTWILIRSCR